MMELNQILTIQVILWSLTLQVLSHVYLDQKDLMIKSKWTTCRLILNHASQIQLVSKASELQTTNLMLKQALNTKEKSIL